MPCPVIIQLIILVLLTTVWSNEESEQYDPTKTVYPGTLFFIILANFVDYQVLHLQLFNISTASGYCSLSEKEYTAKVQFIREGFEKRVRSRSKSLLLDARCLQSACKEIK